jgi:hypothetical protein
MIRKSYSYIRIQYSRKEGSCQGVWLGAGACRPNFNLAFKFKSLSGDRDTRNAAGLTRAQFDTARQRGEQFWLCVVERAAGDDYRIDRIQNPANRVNHYLFDDGWQALAETTAPQI